VVCLLRKYRGKTYFSLRIMVDHKRSTMSEMKKNRSQAFWSFKNLEKSIQRRLGQKQWSKTPEISTVWKMDSLRL